MIMRKIWLVLMTGILFVLATPTFADTAPEAASPYPAWLAPVIVQAEAMPSIGASVQTCMAWAGAISGIATGFSVFLMVLFGSLAGVTHAAGFTAFSTKVQAWEAKVMPWVKYWSMFNVQKPQPPAPSLAAVPNPPPASPAKAA
jgi:hypothetical protein